MKPTDFSNEKLKDIISGEDGLLKEALKKGDLQGMVEIINSVGSILNYNGRQADLAEQGNFTDAETAEAQEAEDTRIEVWETYDDHLQAVNYISAYPWQVRSDNLDGMQRQHVTEFTFNSSRLLVLSWSRNATLEGDSLFPSSIALRCASTNSWLISYFYIDLVKRATSAI